MAYARRPRRMTGATARLKAVSRSAGRPLHEFVNERLRRGPASRQTTDQRRSFTVAARDLGGLESGLSLDSVARPIERVESPVRVAAIA